MTANLQLAAKSQKSRPTGTDSLVAEASGKTPAVAAAAEAAAIAQRGKKRPLHTVSVLLGGFSAPEPSLKV